MFKSIPSSKEGNYLSLDEISSQPENQKCFECDKSPSNWVSVNNGIFLCYDCGNEHKAFSSSISTVKSTTLDMCQRNENNLKLLRVGGNFRFKVFLETYGFPSSLSKKEIYSSQLITFYRRRLRAEAVGEEFNETIPPKSQFWEPYTGTYSMPSKSDLPPPSSNQAEAEKREESASIIPSFISAGASSLWGSVWGATTSVASSVKNKLNESEVGSKILTVGGNAVDAIASTGSKMYEKGSEVISTHGGKTLEVLNQTGSKIMEKGSELYTSGKEKTVAALTYTSGQIYEKGTEIIQGEVVKNLATQAGNSMVYIKDKIVTTVQEASQNQTQPSKNK